MGIFDVSQRYAGLDAKNDPLVKLNEYSALGRLPWPAGGGLAASARNAEVQSRPQALGFGADFQGDCAMRTLQPFRRAIRSTRCATGCRLERFLGLGFEDPVPDDTTVWLYREQLARAGLVDALFDAFDAHLKAQGFLAMGGQMISASVASAPSCACPRPANRLKNHPRDRHRFSDTSSAAVLTGSAARWA